MAFTSILAKPTKSLTQLKRNIGNQPVSLFLDATVKEDYTSTAEPTQHPVEKGADISDHIILRPDTLSISGIITATPFPSALAGILGGVASSSGAKVGQALGPFGNAIGAIVGAQGGSSLASAIFGSSNRDLASITLEFKKIRDAKQPIDVQTGLKLYSNYVLTSFKISRTEKTGGSINVELELKQIITVESQTTSVAIPKVKGAINGSDLGHQSKKDLTSDEAGQGSSLLKKLFGG